MDVFYTHFEFSPDILTKNEAFVLENSKHVLWEREHRFLKHIMENEQTVEMEIYVWMRLYDKLPLLFKWKSSRVGWRLPLVVVVIITFFLASCTQLLHIIFGI